jgi:hypothetical protein
LIAPKPWAYKNWAAVALDVNVVAFNGVHVALSVESGRPIRQTGNRLCSIIMRSRKEKGSIHSSPFGSPRMATRL